LLIPLVIIAILGAQESAEKDLYQYYQQGINAYQNKDYNSYFENFQNAVKLKPTIPEILFHYARASALINKKAEAIKALSKIANMGSYFNVAEDNDFNSIRDSEGYKTILKSFDENKTPINYSEIAFTIPEKDLIPEGITYDPATETFYIGSVYKCKIISIDNDSKIDNFTTEKQDGLYSVCGMKVDARRSILWALSATCKQTKGIKQEDIGFSGVFKYDLNSKKLIKKYLKTNKPQPHLFNDLVISSSGDVYLTDTLTSEIYTISQQKDELELFARQEPYTFPNGIALSDDDKYLFVAHWDGISVFDVNTRTCRRLEKPENVITGAIDGLYFYNGSLIGIQNTDGLMRVTRFYLDENFTQVENMKILEAYHPSFILPTTGVPVGNAFYYIANSQLWSFNDDGTIFPLEKLHPIRILKLKLK
jgi:sugar lactone lactonase YvrE